MTLREKGEPALRRAGHALAHELTRSDRDLRLDHVVRAPERIAKRIQEDEYPFALVLLQRQPGERHRRQRDERQAAEGLSRSPAPISRTTSTGTSKRAVPRSGCLMISTAGTATIGRVRINVMRPTGCAHRDVIAQTTMRTKQTLKSSDGWIDIGPSTIQRRAPDTVRPEQEHGGQAGQAQQVQGRRGANEPLIVEARQQDHEDEADREPEELADDDGAAHAAHVKARECHRAHPDQCEGDHQQHPVHVHDQAPVDPDH